MAGFGGYKPKQVDENDGKVYTDPDFYQGVGTGYITNFLNSAWQGIQETNASSCGRCQPPNVAVNESSKQLEAAMLL